MNGNNCQQHDIKSSQYNRRMTYGDKQQVFSLS